MVSHDLLQGILEYGSASLPLRFDSGASVEELSLVEEEKVLEASDEVMLSWLDLVSDLYSEPGLRRASGKAAPLPAELATMYRMDMVR